MPPDLLASLIDGTVWLSAERVPLPTSAFEWQVHAIDAVRFHASCAQQGYLVLRCADPDPDPASTSADGGPSHWDAIVCDLQGHPAFEIHGLRLARVPVGQGVVAVPATTASSTTAPSTAAPAKATAVSSPVIEAQPPAPVLPEAGRRIAFLRAAPSVVRAPVSLGKPQSLNLHAADDSPAFEAVSVPRPTIALPRPMLEPQAGDEAGDRISADGNDVAACIDLRALGDGVYALRIVSGEQTSAAVAPLLQALDHVRERPEAKVLLLDGLAHAFPPGDAAALDEAIGAGLHLSLIHI